MTTYHELHFLGMSALGRSEPCVLSDILHRMAEHHSKKRSLLRKLSVSGVRQDMTTE